MSSNIVRFIKVIKSGTIILETSDLNSSFNVGIKADLGIGGGSTVTLIETSCRILVDTGYDYEWIDSTENNDRNCKNLINALNNYNLTTDDIDIVFITHWHKDHFGNLGLFRKARYLASKPLVDKYNPDGFTGVNDGEVISDGVKVIFTPGHTAEHASILVDTVLGGVKARVAITGDAIISNSYFNTGIIWRNNADFYSLDEAKRSISKLVEASDLIIPGHGVPFMTYKPAWVVG